eukprot:TRINITY_DN11604_c0_g1_i1.p1 TRINITY_DN11604_c0_g1~~TRINITY_DN11604_c0_g1_i1.p1  ORF type:complete len:284 (+),score=101.82 TRINITY_DN11604_c0_g1_i1:96-854(+)
MDAPVKMTVDLQGNPRRSPLQYTEGNLQMMKEYGMSEKEWAIEFGGRPHQQRQSPVARSDLVRLGVPKYFWDYCSHKTIPVFQCWEGTGGRRNTNVNKQCKHEVHEWEVCMAGEYIRQNQLLQMRKVEHSMFTEAEKNWLYNDPDSGHLIPRTKYGAAGLKQRFYLGQGMRIYDAPTHEATVERHPLYNPNIVRANPNPWFFWHKAQLQQGQSMKFWWNKNAIISPLYDGDRSPNLIVPFDPRVEACEPTPF